MASRLTAISPQKQGIYEQWLIEVRSIAIGERRYYENDSVRVEHIDDGLYAIKYGTDIPVCYEEDSNETAVRQACVELTRRDWQKRHTGVKVKRVKVAQSKTKQAFQSATKQPKRKSKSKIPGALTRGAYPRIDSSETLEATYQFIHDFIIKNGYSPNYSEMMNAFGLRTPGCVWRRLNTLEERGLIQRTGHTRDKQIKIPGIASRMRPGARDRVFEFIVQYISRNGFAPSHSEISIGAGIHRRQVAKCIRQLAAYGSITITPKIERSIRVPGMDVKEYKPERRIIERPIKRKGSVYYRNDGRMRPWISVVRHKGREHHIGSFATETEALEARMNYISNLLGVTE